MAEVIEKEVDDVNPRDDANNDVRAAIAALRGDAPAVQTEAAAEGDPPPSPIETEQAEKPAVERARAPDGKFAPKTEAAPVQAAPDPKSPPAEDVTKASARPPTAAVAPPVSWAADVKAVWPTLPPAVQQAVLKREAEVSQGFRQYSEESRQLKSTLAPIAQEAQRFGLSLEDGVKRLLDGQRWINANPAEAIAWLAQKNGLNLAELAQNPPAVQTQARPDPQFAQVSQTVQSLQERLDSILMDQNMSAVEQFASSKENAYYSDVENDLPDLMRALSAANPSLKGVQLLKEAYDIAIWRNPDVRAKMLEQQQADARKTAAEQAQAKAAQASKAAVSVKGASSPSVASKRPAQEMNGTHVTDDVRAAIQQLRAG